MNENATPLRDGSTIKRFTRIEIIAHHSDVVVIFAEAITSNDETVIVSRQACGATRGLLGRSSSDSQPDNEFHLLE